MSDKLDELVSGVQKHIADKRAELTALQTQMRALQSAHADLQQEVQQTQARLWQVRDAIGKSDEELDRRRKEASNIANGIISDAHAKKAAAENQIRILYVESAKNVERAREQASDMEAEAAAKKAELQVTINQINAAQSELAALKKSAGDWSKS